MRLRGIVNTAAELKRVDRLLIGAYDSGSRRQLLDACLAAQPDGWFVVADGDEIISVGGALAYGTFCWIGLMATKPQRRGEGLASKLCTHLVEWAQRRGCRTIALDASAAGLPIYERLGFMAINEVVEYSARPGCDAELQFEVDRLPPGEVESILELDRRVFGGDRAALLHALVGDRSCTAYALRTGDEIGGYLLSRGDLLGPGCAVSADVAEQLLSVALGEELGAQQAATERRIMVPAESSYSAVIDKLGLRESRRLTHMRLGNRMLPGERQYLLAQASYATG